MDTRLVKEFDAHPFSAARRLFVLQQMLAMAAKSRGDEFHALCQVIISIDKTILDEEFERRRPDRGDDQEWMRLYSPPTTADERHQWAHQKFLDLIRFLLRTRPPGEAHRLLAPALRQVRRLQIFAHRNPGNGCTETSQTDDMSHSHANAPRPIPA